MFPVLLIFYVAVDIFRFAVLKSEIEPQTRKLLRHLGR